MPTGYSGKPLFQKLGLKPEWPVVLIDAPDGYAQWLEADFEPVLVPLSEQHLFIHAFITSRSQLESGIDRWRNALAPTGRLWISWPKKSGAIRSDVTDNTLREVCLPALVDIKVCSVSEDWSGLLFVIPKSDRP